jgi:hypothetical protein
MGRLLKHGDKFRKLPLLRLRCGEFERIEENEWSTLDMEVHEHLIVEGDVGEIKAPIVHSDFKGLSAYYDRHNKYSSWEAKRFLTLQQADARQFTKRQKLKYKMMGSVLFPPLYFVASYVFKMGFLDGVAGFRFSVSKMLYFYQVGFKIAEEKQASST